MPTLIIDIETVGEDYDSFDDVTKGSLEKWIKRETGDAEERKRLTEQVRSGTALSPLTGSIVAIGVLDYEHDKGTVFVCADEKDMPETVEGNITFKPNDEKGMLHAFWSGAGKYDTFVTFNGRGFDIPYLMVRSAVHSIRPTKNLMSNRYLGSQWRDSKHVDLAEELSFYGARRRESLHLWTRAFGIESPKAAGVSGGDVSELIANKNYIDLARYNMRDIIATKELYNYWLQYFKF